MMTIYFEDEVIGTAKDVKEARRITKDYFDRMAFNGRAIGVRMVGIHDEETGEWSSLMAY